MSAGDVVKVKVVEIDEQRKRIALTMKLQDNAADVTAAARAGATGTAGKEGSAKSSRGRGKPKRANRPATQSHGGGKSSANAAQRNSQEKSSSSTGGMGSLGAALLDAKNRQQKNS